MRSYVGSWLSPSNGNIWETT